MKRFWKILRCIVLIIVILFAAFVAVLTIADYKPDDIETLSVTDGTASELLAGSQIKVMTWNIGYAGLGEDADFFMDGGEEVRSTSKEGVKENLQAIVGQISQEDADILCMQEVDVKAHRTYNIDEKADLLEAFGQYDSSFAYNYKAIFVPYPMPPIGQVNAGIMTMSKYDIVAAERLQLPVPFKWPISTANLKRCLAVNRIPIADSDKELVIINLHLEAYDDGEGKIAQTAMLNAVMQTEYEKGNYVIAAGDFNQSFSNLDLDKYAVKEGLWEPGIIDVKDFGDDMQLAMDDTCPSCRSLDQKYQGADPEQFQFYMIDGFIVSENIQIDQIETMDLQFKNSDHNPVMLEITLK